MSASRFATLVLRRAAAAPHAESLGAKRVMGRPAMPSDPVLRPAARMALRDSNDNSPSATTTLLVRGTLNDRFKDSLTRP